MKTKLVKLLSKKCVNSKWTARWLAGDKQEYCQCMVSCKVRAVIENVGGETEVIITEDEYKELQ